MAEWTKEVSEKELKHEMENIYMLARLKRTVTHDYTDPANPIPRGPKSNDPDWDHIIRFCEQAGLKVSILRTASA